MKSKELMRLLRRKKSGMSLRDKLGSELFSDYEIFTSNKLKKYVASKLKFLFDDFDKTPLELKIAFDNAGSVLARTDNRTIIINAGHSFLKGTRLERFEIILGLAAHEASHYLFTNFTQLKAYPRNILDGYIYPNFPVFTEYEREDKKVLDENARNLSDFLEGKIGFTKSSNPAFSNREWLARMAKWLLNILEDGRIEYIFENHAYNHRALYDGLTRFRNAQEKACPTFDEILSRSGEPREPGFIYKLEAIYDMILHYVRFGDVKGYRHEEHKKSELASAFHKIVPYVDTYIEAMSANECLDSCNKIMITLWPYYMEIVEDLNSNLTKEAINNGKAASAIDSRRAVFPGMSEDAKNILDNYNPQVKKASQVESSSSKLDNIFSKPEKSSETGKSSKTSEPGKDSELNTKSEPSKVSETSAEPEPSEESELSTELESSEESETSAEPESSETGGSYKDEPAAPSNTDKEASEPIAELEPSKSDEMGESGEPSEESEPGESSEEAEACDEGKPSSLSEMPDTEGCSPAPPCSNDSDSFSEDDFRREKTPDRNIGKSDEELAEQLLSRLENELIRRDEKRVNNHNARAFNEMLDSVIDYGSIHDGIKSKIVRDDVTPRNISEYEASKSKISKLVDKMLKKSEFLKDEQEEILVKNKYSGRRFNASATAKGDYKYFSRELRIEPSYLLDVIILVDESGSMGGKRIEAAKMAAICCYEFMNKALGEGHISIYGHYTGTYEVFLKCYADFDNPDDDDKYRIMQITAGGSNRDGYALRFVKEKLSLRDAERRLIITISDGKPADIAYSGEPAIRDIRSVLREAERENIMYIAAAIGDDKEIIKEIYGEKHFLDLSDLGELPNRLMSLIGRLLK